MNVPLEATQPPAHQLVSYGAFLVRLEKLKASPRVKVERLGYSHGGRGLFSILIADEAAIPLLEHHRQAAASLRAPAIHHATLSEVESQARPEFAADVRRPVLLAGLSFGHEASHVEGLLDLAERLAWDKDKEVANILEKLIVLIMPMMNPDGRDMSIDIWSQYPLTEDSSAGNLYGFYVNRDFLHLTQPETRAVLKLYREWHPLAVLDTHEDVYCLGVLNPEVCWAPYTGQATAEEAPQEIREIIARFAGAIRQEWERLGFTPLPFDMFAHPMPGEPEDGPYWQWSGNLVQAMTLHGIPAVITESGRTPGVQTWEDRVRQKSAAGRAMLREIARDATGIAEAVFAHLRRAAQDAQARMEAFVIPKDQQEAAAVACLIETLCAHDIRVYETGTPYPAYVVPVSQAAGAVARTLLSTQYSLISALPPALGVAVTAVDDLPAKDQEVFRQAPLMPVVEAPIARVQIWGGQAGERYAIPNTMEGVRLVNRLWQLGSPVSWLSRSLAVQDRQLDQGTFVVEQVPSGAMEDLTRGLQVELYSLLPGNVEDSYSLRRPRVALYAGQGVDRPDASATADIWWALDRWGFEYARLRAPDITPAVLDRFDILIVPSGDANEIVNGWSEESLLNKHPWELPGKPQGIGSEGLEAIHQFVEQGGHYFGIGSGGGLLATRQYAKLMDLEVMAHDLGSARVLLRIDAPEHPLLFGLNGYHDAGRWVPGFMPAYYHSEAFTHTPGGPVFRKGEGATILASYYQVDHDPARRHVIQERYLTAAEGGVAIAFEAVGRGWAAVIGVRPGFRASWTRSCRLLSNAIFLAATR